MHVIHWNPRLDGPNRRLCYLLKGSVSCKSRKIQDPHPWCAPCEFRRDLTLQKIYQLLRKNLTLAESTRREAATALRRARSQARYLCPPSTRESVSTLARAVAVSPPRCAGVNATGRWQSSRFAVIAAEHAARTHSCDLSK